MCCVCVCISVRTHTDKYLGRNGAFFTRCFSGPELRNQKLTDLLLSEFCDKGINDVTLG